MVERTEPRRFMLLTGAAGRIGSSFFEAAKDRYRFRLADRETAGLEEAAGREHETLRLDVADLEACQAACRGVETVIHLAADPSPEADFYGSLLDNNIKGTYNVFRAAKDQGCRRVIFASSIHAVVGYPQDMQTRPETPVRPANMYGVSKCFGEAVAACFATDGLSAIAIRIGAYEPDQLRQEPTTGLMMAYVSRRDMNHLLERCVETANISFAIVHGESNNRFKRMDLTATRELLGYEPEDDAFALFGDNERG